MDNTLIPNGTSTNDVQFQSDDNRHYLLKDDLGTPENPESTNEDHLRGILSHYSPSNPLDFGMYQYMWDNHYSKDSEHQKVVDLLGYEYSDERNEEENRERRYQGEEEYDDSDYYFEYFWSDPTDHDTVRDYIHELLEEESDSSVIDLLVGYHNQDRDVSVDHHDSSSSNFYLTYSRPTMTDLHQNGVLRHSYGELITMVKNCEENQFGVFKSLRINHNLYSVDSWGKCNCCGEDLTFDDIKNTLVERMTRLLGMDSRITITDIYGDNIPDGYQCVDMEVFREEDTHSDDLIEKDLLDLKEFVMSVYFNSHPSPSTDNGRWRGFCEHMVDVIPILEPVPTHLYLTTNNHPKVILFMVEYLLNYGGDLLSKWNVKTSDGVSNV